MKNVDYWDDSQFDSYGAFDDSMNMVVNDSITNGDSSGQFFSEGMGMVVEDSEEDENVFPCTLPCLPRRKTAAATNDKILTQPRREEKATTMASKGDGDFDLNNSPVRGRFKLDYPEPEECTIEMLRLLLPDFY